MNLVEKQGFDEQNQQRYGHTSKTMASLDMNDQNRIKPNLLRINADNQDKKFMCIFWSLFLLFILTISIVSRTLPHAIKSIENSKQLSGTPLQGCTNPNYFENDVLKCNNPAPNILSAGLIARQLSSLNQFVLASLLITPKDMNVQTGFSQTVRYTFYQLKQQKQDQKVIFKSGDLYMNETTQFRFDSNEADQVYASNDSKTKIGYRVLAGFIGQFPAETLYTNIQFEGPNQDVTNIAKIQMEGYKISKGFTQFTIAIRYIFFGISLTAAILYITKFRKTPQNQRIIEQQLVLILSVLLVFFNDPLYSITVLKQNMASSFFSTLFVVTFIVFLIFLWVVFLDRIVYEQGQKQTEQITRYKIGYFIVLFVLLMVVYMQYAAYRLNDHPLMPSQKLASGKFLVMDIISSIWFGLVVLYLAFQFIKICCKQQQLLWRSQIFVMYSTLFMFATTVFIFTDNALGAYYYDGTTVMYFYGLMNLYTWYLQYMYSSAKHLNEFEMGLNSDEKMSVQTVQFNDLTINLDDDFQYNKYHKKESPKKKEIPSWSVPINQQAPQVANQRNFSIQDQQQNHAESHNIGYNFKNRPLQSKQVPNQKQKVDFFNQNTRQKILKKQQIKKRIGENQNQSLQNGKIRPVQNVYGMENNGVYGSNRTNLITLNMSQNGSKNAHDIVLTPVHQNDDLMLSISQPAQKAQVKHHELILSWGTSSQVEQVLQSKVSAYVPEQQKEQKNHFEHKQNDEPLIEQKKQEGFGSFSLD